MKQTLIDAVDRFVHEDATWHADAGGFPWRVTLRTCRGGIGEGVQLVELDNGKMTVVVCPTRGMGIWQVRKGDQILGWRSPVAGPVHPNFVPLYDPTGLGWLEGFDELMCRCGLGNNGAPDFDGDGTLLKPLHGRVANLPAHRLEVEVDHDKHTMTLKGVVDEVRFHFQHLRLTSTVTIDLEGDTFRWSDRVDNLSGRPATMQMLYHTNFGAPLLRGGAKIVAPWKTVAPWNEAALAEGGVENFAEIPPPTTGFAEQVYVCQLLTDSSGFAPVLLKELNDDQAISLRYSTDTLPCFTIWRNMPALEDGYVLGLEPGTNYPNPYSFEEPRDRVVRFAPGDSWAAEVELGWYDTQDQIKQVESEIERLQAGSPPKVQTAIPRDLSDSAAKG